MKKFLKWFVIIFIGLVVVGSLLPDEEKADKKEDAAPKATETATKEEKPKEEKKAEPKKEEKKEFAVGDDVTAGKFTYKVNSTESKKELKNILGNKTTDGQFLVVNLTVTNKDKKARIADGNMFKLKDASGAEYSTAAELDMYVNEDVGFFLKEINPNMNKTGNVVFEVPADAQGLTLEVSSGFGWSGGKSAAIKLN
ncbi:DUF4352 domain-containing protein [Bacillus wiedmannii]|uniref:DUF4352 domain-containing protein n=1 Tax=Bacillus wiedmannii TaxID=1890302 RepID=UPI000BF096D6|nr:DUF4352 domain-containing protein [Bacillus wiedmannii]PEM08488.1 DUF4352 domain-containing protein [Bacillus wiedmannii]